MKQPWGALLLIGVALLTAAALRLPELSSRVMHGDEAQNAVRAVTLLETGEYSYEPEEFHGPTLYYSSLPMLGIRGATTLSKSDEADFRVVTVLYGLGLIALVGLLLDALGLWAAVVAAFGLALSPAFAYYSRFFIHESLLVFFSLAAIAAGWRSYRTRRGRWLLLLGLFVGLMHATKETCIIAYGCAGVALVGAWLWSKRGPILEEASRDLRLPRWSVGGGVALAIIVSVGLYSNFSSDASGPIDSLRSYSTYLERGSDGGAHEHPFLYYLSRLAFHRAGPGPWWSEAPLLILGALGIGATILRRGTSGASLPFLRFLSIYAVTMTLIYSSLRYKTPWCLLEFYLPLVLLAGVGAVATLRWMRRTKGLLWVGIAALLLAAAQLGWQANRACVRFGGDYRNPYVYSQPLSGARRLGEWIKKLSDSAPSESEPLVAVLLDDPWPLPWVLRHQEKVGYWEPSSFSPTWIDESCVIVTTPAALEQRFPWRAEWEKHGSFSSHYGIFPGQAVVVCVSEALHGRYRAAAEKAGPR